MGRIPRQLVTALRAVGGLDVLEVPGCWGRGSSTFNPQGVIVHATAGSDRATDQGELNVILNGSSSAPPPISQFMLGRTGRVYFAADGRCNHALSGFRGTRFAGIGNSGLIGIEGCNNNRGESWDRSYRQYVTLVAVVCMFYGWNPTDRVRGHKEHQPGGKSDPTFDMARFRADVARRIAELSGAIAAEGPAPAAKREQEDDGVKEYLWFKRAGDKVGNATSGDVTWACERPYLADGDPLRWEEFTSERRAIGIANVNASNTQLPEPEFDALRERYGA